MGTIYRSIRKRIKSDVFALKNWLILQRIKRKQKVTIVFYAADLSMWHYQELYNELKKFTFLDVHIVISPYISFSKDERINKARLLRDYFKSIGCDFHDFDDTTGEVFDVKGLIKPDILFYPQPYGTSLDPKHEYPNFPRSLYCYYPYFYYIEKSNYLFNLDFHNRAWKLYYAATSHKEDARKYADNKGRNVIVVGYPNTELFLKTSFNEDVWKKQDHKKKRLIWAPHYSIEKNIFQISNFLWMADLMLDVAKKYKDTLQITFKPHPKLLSELYKNIDWGQEKANAYYQEWETMENGQLETGNFVDLFMTSDAMVHDSSSFMAEYLYAGKPVMFVHTEHDSYMNDLSELGLRINELHYAGRNEDDILNFIKNQILMGIDPLKEDRELFVEHNLMPPNSKSVTANTIDDLLKSLGKL